jgi:DNA-binding transcriptional ArsR family regulator
MEPEAFQTLLRFLKALAHESRLKLLGLLADREYSVGELADLLDLKEPTISHHLAKLQELELVVMRAEGTAHYYRLNSETLYRLNRELFTPEQVASIADNVEGASWERKVLKTYFADGRLTKIPDTRKKRDVILKWLATQFEQGVRYPEAQVNAIIKRYHPDTATLRRELVGSKLMQRESGIYWRVPLAEEQA